MRNRLALMLVAFSLILLAGPKTFCADDPQPPKGFTAIFNGKDLSGWHGMPHFDPYKLAAMPEAERKAQIEKWAEDAKKHWTVDNGELVNDGNGAYLTTDKDYEDIEFLVEYKTVPKADSGIYLRCTPQVQIWDYTKEGGKWNLGADKGSGGLWNNEPKSPGRDPLVLADKPFGEWNKFRIIMVGERVTVWLNDKLVVEHSRLENFWKKDEVNKLNAELKKLQDVATTYSDDDKKKMAELNARIQFLRAMPLMRAAPIQLQTHGGEIRWRNMYIREIPSTEANEILAKHSTEGFESVFNGKDFTGWAGPIDQYEVKDGAIVCKPHKGGTIFTKDEYQDFVARVEYKLPPAGNNGLAIRYPGHGDTAYVGMCEVQVLDDTAPAYKKLDPRQYCGSVYGIVAAHRNYLRPVGEWNWEEVTVKGPNIKVELNGTVIVDCDVSKVTTYMANHPHPGKDNVKGSFGFAGHNDPVAFRNIFIKKLETK
ncbi:MAG TPA: DUF1080 domain-containing protein [Gemmataceae bacterium]|nr:DUF1080 domain-containing protein [Gemmataceae bacterium]